MERAGRGRRVGRRLTPFHPALNLDTVGIILMVVGAIGLLFSLLFLSASAPWGRREERVIERDREYIA